MADPSEDSVAAARRSFNAELLSADYPEIHGDDHQIGRLLDFLAPRADGRYLDLATGAGAVAFALAARHPEAHVHGIDIADQAITRNRAAARAQGHDRLQFHTTGGRAIDFPDRHFDGIASRFALHHFPEPATTLGDLARVLRPGGALAIADAVRHPADTVDFINRFQALKPDGHIRIYDPAELVALFRPHGFQAAERFGSKLSFTRDLNPHYSALIAQTPPEILKLYDVRVEGAQAALTFEILNVRFLASNP
ncbi:MAG: class I SAM-dependent methyltransferase [Pseudomonadota bacterium]